MTTRCRFPIACALVALLAASVSMFAQNETPAKKPAEMTPAEKAKVEQEKKAAKAAEEAQKRTWTTVYRPTHVPDRVILTWNGDPSTSQAVTWRTDPTVAKAVGQVALSEGGPAFDPLSAKNRPVLEKVTTVAGKTEFLKSDLFEANYHSVSFTGLKPGTRYVYRVGDGATWSEWFEFRTPSDKPEPLSFIYFGDAQNEVKSHWSRVVRGAFADMPRAHFILHAGDLINRANADGEWGEWHQAAGWINGMVPSVPTPGNHEYGAPPSATAKVEEKTDQAKDAKAPRPKSRLSVNWRPQFTLPENGPPGLEETVYYFDIQGVRVISLNSNEKQEEQVPWMEQVLANNPNKWTVITFHHPIYSTAKGRDNKKLRELWRPVFDKYTPDLVLQGHDHTYGRSGVMREDNLVTGARVEDERGTVYVVSVSGPKLYKLEQAEWMKASAADAQLYQLIRIEGDTLHYEARAANGALYDSFDLKKRAKKPAGGAGGLGVYAWAALGVIGAVGAAVVGHRLLLKAAGGVSK